MVRKYGENDARFVVSMPHQDKLALFGKADELHTDAASIVRDLIQGFLRGEIELPSEGGNKKTKG